MRNTSDPARLIPLKTYRIALRKAHVEIRPGELALQVPSYFGRNVWRLPIGEVSVVDLSSPNATVEGSDVYAEPLAIPYLATTSPNVRPTLMLLFTTPLPMPPLRTKPEFMEFGGSHAPRPAAVTRVDGVALRAHRPAEATARLVAAGVHHVRDPRAWLRRHRRPVTDPAGRAAVQDRLSRRRILGKIAVAIFLGVFLPTSLLLEAQLNGADLPDWLALILPWLWALFAVTNVTLLVLWLVRRRINRSLNP